jgi:uncharacterized protein
MIRVVLDTNIIIFALLSPQGPPAQIFLMILLGRETQLCLSGDVFAEYEEVLRRPRLNRSDREIAATLRAVREKGLWVKSVEKVNACTDPDDNVFLECAQAAAAHYLITGNAKHFPAAWGSTQIMSARQFLHAVA